MKILILHSSSDLYGAGKILLITVAAIQEAGHTPIVIVSEPGPLSDQLQQNNVDVKFIKLGILRRKYKSIPGIWNRIKTLYKAHRSIRKIIFEEEIDLLYSNTTAVLVGALVARSSGIRHIWHIHEIIQKPKILASFLGKIVNRYSHKVIVVSNAVLDHWKQWVNHEKITCIHNGINYSPYVSVSNESNTLKDHLLPENANLLVGMIGRVHHWKGQDYFLEIASHLLKMKFSVHFIMVGDVFPGNEYLYEKLNHIKEEKELKNHVTDLGYRTDIPALLQSFDLFVLPSVQPDPFPTVILEAMASAKMVAATAHGGALEMITDGADGVLIPWNNAEVAAEKISIYLQNPALRKAIGNAAQSKVMDHFSENAFKKRLMDVILNT